ncbi:aldose epimerase family protein [Salipiger sp.]|uniref:aldose epimerase family protein n=1 Tax=Salipiger sp. TaxID=2078585 RepID=UPI003A96E220
MSGQVDTFGTAPDGSAVLRARIEGGGMSAAIMTWGASLQDLRMRGVGHPLVLGAPDLAPYLTVMRHFGAIAGPVANRIAGGRAPLDGQILQFDRNERDRTTLHGGAQGTSRSNWTLDEAGSDRCRLSIRLPDAWCGFPGPMEIAATYRLDPEGALVLELEASTAAPTFCNLAHHSYWCLDGSGSIDSHRLTIPAESYLPVDADLIPQGGPVPVAGTRFDFRAPRAVTAPGEAGVDHNFCLRDATGLRTACVLTGVGLCLTVTTTEPGLQVYDGSGMNTGSVAGLGGHPYGPRAGIALEPQRWPDAPNRPDFPSVRLDPGQVYRQVSRFHVRREGSA